MDTKPYYVEPPPIPSIKETSTGKSDEYYVKLKLCIDPTSSTSDIYEFRMSLFDHGEPEDFLFFVQNFNMTLASTGTLQKNVKVQYLHTLVRGEAFCRFDLFSNDVENVDTSLTVDNLLKGLACNFSCDFPFKKKSVQCAAL